MLKKGILKIESIKIKGHGAVILTGPSGCGKGEIANYIMDMFSLNKEYHLSMGQILRDIITMSRADKDFLKKLNDNYNISTDISIFDDANNPSEVITKAKQYREQLKTMIKKDPFFKDMQILSQYAWLTYAVANGLLVPKDWTNRILEAKFESNPDLCKSIFLIDGYPRTIPAAVHMLKLFKKLDIPIIKVIHLSITKTEMIRRAKLRNRLDDNIQALENRFQFYIEQVQPSVDEMKRILGSEYVSLIDAHQPVFDENGSVNVEKSIRKVAKDVIEKIDLSF
jgi:adenylate kinase family enzyme